MTSIRAVVSLVCVLAVSACGGVTRPDAGSTELPAPTDAAVTERPVESVQPVDDATELDATTSPASPSELEPDRVTTTTTKLVRRETTTTQAETIYLEAVQEALDGLDDLIGAFESQVGSIDLDEGETP